MNARLSIVSMMLESLSSFGGDAGGAALLVTPLGNEEQVLRATVRALGWAVAAAIAVAVPATVMAALLWLASLTLGYTGLVGALYAVLAGSVVAWLLLVRGACATRRSATSRPAAASDRRCD